MTSSPGPTDSGPDVGPTTVHPASRVRMLREMGHLEVTSDPEGRQICRLSAEGMRLGHALAINVDLALLRALLRKPY